MYQINMRQLIEEAERLANRFMQLDQLATQLIEDAKNVNEFVISMRQYHEDIEVLNKVLNNRSNAETISYLKQQNLDNDEPMKENHDEEISVEDEEEDTTDCENESSSDGTECKEGEEDMDDKTIKMASMEVKEDNTIKMASNATTVNAIRSNMLTMATSIVGSI